MTNALAPLAEPFPAEIATILDRYPKIDGYTLSLFRTFANSRRFLEKCVMNLLDDESPLSLRQREIVILRTCANLRCEYEWGVHVAVFCDAAGLSDEQVASTVGTALPANVWSDEDKLLLSIVDDLCTYAAPDKSRQSLFDETFSRSQRLEVLALVGNYHTISFVAKTAELEPEIFAARFPENARMDTLMKPHI